MAFPILGAGSLASGYNVENSCRFDNTGGSALGGTFGTPTNAKTWTLSMWYKKSSGTTSGGQVLFGARSGYENFFLHEETIRIDWNNASGGTINWAPFIRDHSAWYHIVLAHDTAQNTDTNRAKLYINGTQITTLRSGVTQTWPAQNLETGYNVDGVAFYVSSYNGIAAEINGYLAEVAFIDGSQLAASSFGETDEDSGIWKPKDISDIKDAVTFGNNGFCLEFKQTGTGTNSSGIGADTSGNDNHLSVTGLAAIDQCTDTPTNNFATFNPLEPDVASGETLTPVIYSEGNLKVVGTVSGTGYSFAISTIAVSSGKWYYEFYRPDTDSGTVICGCENPGLYNSSGLHRGMFEGGGVGIRGSNGTLYNDGSESSPANGTEYKDAGDILSVKLNMDDNEISFSTNGAAYTSGISLSSYVLSSGFVSPGANIGDDEELIVNFGNPVWALSSGNADARGYGNFEYAVPSGYYALCTKNLGAYG